MKLFSKRKVIMKNIADCEFKVKEAKNALSSAEMELQDARNAAHNAVVNRPCPSCGFLVNIGNPPSKEGLPVSNPAQCEECGRRYDVKVSYGGGSTYELASYPVQFTFRGYLSDQLSVEKLTGEQIELEKSYLFELADGKTPNQANREKDLIFEQMRRQDASRIDTLVKQNASIIELLKAKLGV
jgi:hypothetical protein